jgi:hypothetical protein
MKDHKETPEFGEYVTVKKIIISTVIMSPWKKVS